MMTCKSTWPTNTYLSGKRWQSCNKAKKNSQASKERRNYLYDFWGPRKFYPMQTSSGEEAHTEFLGRGDSMHSALPNPAHKQIDETRAPVTG
mmetsp:Transcript_3340/g.9323  ORF Transcript_3340/g.9323 Transcript_3340/m.9323 type:complete len:92 (+) Transcript_3340:484-759(+)